MKNKLAVYALLVAGLLSGTVRANETSVRQAFQAKFPKMPIESVNKTPFPGIYEVVLEGQILYTDEKLSYVFDGIARQRAREREPRRNVSRSRVPRCNPQTSRLNRVRGNAARDLHSKTNCFTARSSRGALKGTRDDHTSCGRYCRRFLDKSKGIGLARRAKSVGTNDKGSPLRASVIAIQPRSSKPRSCPGFGLADAGVYARAADRRSCRRQAGGGSRRSPVTPLRRQQLWRPGTAACGMPLSATPGTGDTARTGASERRS